jgi:methylenetetrahydrofolate reductase (NADPH)
MAKITERCFEATGHTTIICDFSPPRSGDPELWQPADLDADFISVAYNPGRSVRVNSPMLAATIKRQAGKEVVFTLGTRDMNKLALQSQLLGAQLLGLENVIVVQGDPFSGRDLALVKPVDDYRPTQLISAISKLNEGVDFRESKLRSATDFCIGATVDLGRGIQHEAQLARLKVAAGAQFFITQPIFDPTEASSFGEAYARAAGKPLTTPVFFGLQVLEQDGVIFSSVPALLRQEIESGRSGVEIALELYQRFQENGLHNIYLVPPIRRGGARNYAAAQEVLAATKRV